MVNSLEVLLEKSQHDLTAVNLLLKEASAPEDIIAFHLQQMVEKLLKVASIHYNIDFKLTHDLSMLIRDLEDTDSSFCDYYNLAEDLSPHAVLTRYEEGYSIDRESLENLLKSALNLQNKVYSLVHK